jgi:hypothetical protein
MLSEPTRLSDAEIATLLLAVFAHDRHAVSSFLIRFFGDD